MDPITLSLILMGVGGAVKGGSQLFQGISDKRKGDELERQAGDRPDYQIPDAVKKYLATYKNLASSGMPGEDTMREDILASTARTAGTAAQLADSPVGALTALGGAQQRELGALRDLGVRASQYQVQARQNLAQAYGQYGQYEQEQWRQNELLPWEIDMNRAMQYQTQGKGNIMGAADSFGSTMAQMGSFVGTNAMYNNMYPTMPQGGQGGQQGYGGTNPWGSSYMPNIPYQYTLPVGTNPNTPADSQAEKDMYGNTLPY